MKILCVICQKEHEKRHHSNECAECSNKRSRESYHRKEQERQVEKELHESLHKLM